MSPPSPPDAASGALQHAERLLREGELRRGEAALRALLEAHPSEARARLLLGSACASAGRLEEAIGHLARALQDAPDLEAAAAELAGVCRQAERGAEAETVLAGFCERHPRAAKAWQAYADTLFDNDKPAAARAAQRQAVEVDRFFADMRRAVQAAADGAARQAEAIYRDILRADPNHVHALIGLANAALDGNAPGDAERLLKHALSVSPNTSHAHRGMARWHMNRGRFEPAEAAARRATVLNPELAESWTTLGTVCAGGLKQAEAARAFKQSLAIAPRQPRVQLSLGHVQKALGDRAGSERAYKAALGLAPQLGEAWWSLADLKTYAFSDAEVAAMRRVLDQESLGDRDRAAVRFALGKAAEDAGAVDDAFEHYRRGNAIRRRHESFDVERFERQCRRLQETFTAARIERKQAPAAPGATPIFVVGLPRSGSTLVDQILSSHSQVRGTMELPHILGYVREMDPERGGKPPGYPAAVEGMSPADFNALGQRYLEETRPYRGDAPFFVDKMPNNFMHVGLIACMLPAAVFVDARRHPLGCCFSIFKQSFARGQAFGYDLDALAAYYRGYLGAMAHWDRVLPGRVHRVIYERMVDATEAETRSLLDGCGLAFEPACLRFHETQRVVRTASAEQVRRPIYQQAKTQWQAFEAHLGSLKAALGPALDAWQR